MDKTARNQPRPDDEVQPANEDQGVEVGEPLAPTSNEGLLERRTRRALTSGPLRRPKGQKEPKRSLSATGSFIRDPLVRAYVLQEAQGNCECCGCPAPFKDRHGQAHLQVHHVRTLADGGSDTVENAVAVCPNCHARLHHGQDAADLADALYGSVKRLRRETH